MTDKRLGMDCAISRRDFMDGYAREAFNREF